MQKDLAAAMADIRDFAKAPAPTPGVVEMVTAKLEYLTAELPDGELRELSSALARQVAEVHAPSREPSVSSHLRLLAALTRLETRFEELTRAG